jgi:uncharacterized protein YceK
MKQLFIALAITTALLLGGCVSVNPTPGPTHGTDLLIRASVQYASIRYLSDHRAQIADAKRLVDEVEAALTENPEVTLDVLETVIIESIKWDAMAPEDKVLLATLLGEIKYQVGLRIGEGVLDENDRVFARSFLTWIRQAIAMAGG